MLLLHVPLCSHLEKGNLMILQKFSIQQKTLVGFDLTNSCKSLCGLADRPRNASEGLMVQRENGKMVKLILEKEKGLGKDRKGKWANSLDDTCHSVRVGLHTQSLFLRLDTLCNSKSTNLDMVCNLSWNIYKHIKRNILNVCFIAR